MSYEYDPNNYRIRRTSVLQNSVTEYTYDNNGSVTYQKETVGTNVTTRSYAYFDGKIIGFYINDKKYYTVTDMLGTVVDVYAEDGTEVWAMDYTSFGMKGGEKVAKIQFEAMFTGKDMDCETGLTYHWNRWRGEEGYNWISEDSARDGTNWYGYAGQNPLICTDPNGREAWNSINEWNSDYIEQYSEYVDSKIIEYQDNNKKFTCEDLSLCLLIDFAAENSLPVSIVNGSGKYSSFSKDFNNIDDFKNIVLSTTGASDLLLNTVPISVSNMKPGDLICMDTGIPGGKKDQQYSHIQVVNIVLENILGIRQGNISNGSSKYNSIFYGGELISNRVYDYKNDVFINTSAKVQVPEAKDSFGMSFRRWKFYGM